MSQRLQNHVGGRWVEGPGPGTRLLDPVTGAELVRVSSEGLHLSSAFADPRDVGGAEPGSLRALRFSLHFHHRRAAVQADGALLERLSAQPFAA